MSEESAIGDEATGGCHSRTTGDRLFTAALVVSGLAGILTGAACLLWMSGPEVGITPFAHVEGGDLGHVFVTIRRAAFLTIALGITAFLAGVFIRPRLSRRKCAG